MKKIGILTYHPYDNYGAVLQAYALQTYISKHLNEDVEIIDFCTDDQLLDNDILQLKRKNTLRSILSTYYRKLPIYFQLSNRKKRFNHFRKNYLHLTKRFKEPESLLNNLPTKDIFITGSDQVFNPYADYTDVYYLGFKKNGAKKVAYAPSFGVSNLKESVDDRLINYIKDFDYISCREQVGADFLSKLLGKKIPCVVDPVFLLNKDEWSVVIKDFQLNKRNRNGYIFVYRLNGGIQLMKLAQKISKKVGLPIVCVASDNLFRKGCEVVRNAGPSELLGLIKDASYVVTDSFHGTALALVMGVKVISYIAFPQASSRITTIMDSVGLSQNIIYSVDDFDFDLLDFADYHSKMQLLISESKQYLQESLV